jgi:hypothetical protein
MIGGRLLFRELRIAIGQALQLGALRGRARSVTARTDRPSASARK